MTSDTAKDFRSLSPTVTALITASNVAVASEEDAGWASDHLAKVRKMRKAVEAKYKDLKAPFDAGIKGLKAEFDKLVEPLKSAERSIEGAILTYRTQAKEDADAAAIQLTEAHQDAVDAALLRGEPVENVLPPALPAGPARGFETTDGSTVTARRVPTFQIVDESKVPLSMMIDGVETRLWQVDTAAIQKVRQRYGDKASPIPGVVFTYRETLAVR